jgi:NADH-quinone oxidoreductase subunit J
MHGVVATISDWSGVGAIALPLALGFLSIYLLLPRPRPIRRRVGSACAGAAVASGGWLLFQPTGENAEMFLFYAFSALAVIAGGLLITQRNPVHAALAFALVVLSTCGLFLLQAAPFLMAATIIVYAGAIVVTFLFVIMLAQQVGLSDADARSREPLLSAIAGFVLLGTLLSVLQVTYDSKGPAPVALQPSPLKPERFSGFSGSRVNQPLDSLESDASGRRLMPAENVAGLGRALFTDYLIPVELGGTLLLVAVIGAIVIAGRRPEGLR